MIRIQRRLVSWRRAKIDSPARSRRAGLSLRDLRVEGCDAIGNVGARDQVGRSPMLDRRMRNLYLRMPLECCRRSPAAFSLDRGADDAARDIDREELLWVEIGHGHRAAIMRI